MKSRFFPMQKQKQVKMTQDLSQRLLRNLKRCQTLEVNQNLLLLSKLEGLSHAVTPRSLRDLRVLVPNKKLSYPNK